MQEGILALMQLPKTVCVVEDLRDAGCGFVSVMTHPTTGGLLASFASLGDVLIAEPGVLMSFAGPRVVQQTTREKLPDDFGIAESNYRFGHVDAVLPRPRSATTSPASFDSSLVRDSELRSRERLSRLQAMRLLGRTGLSGELERLQRQLDRIKSEPTDEEIWRSVELARHEDRPYTLDYVSRLLEDWVELHGDRNRADDAAIVTGLGASTAARSRSSAIRRGGTTSRSGRSELGMAYPEGYRKAMRVMELAERHGYPVLSLVDTPGAYPGVAAEQHGQGGAIAHSQAVMARLGVPTVACVIGEGGSGGAIAIALSDRVLMQEHAIYSVITPEGCAAILWRDASEARKAAAAFKPDAAHCLELGVIDAIVPEPDGGAQLDHDAAARLLGDSIREALDDLDGIPADELRRRRRARYRTMGVFARTPA